MRKVLLVLIILLLSSINARADDSPEGVIKGTGGVLLGTPIGFFTGMVRGAVTKAQTFTQGIQDGFGRETTVSKIISYPLGVVSGGLVGGAAGAVKGVVNGIYYGVKDPFSQENFTVDGDFDDFDAFNYSKAQYGTL
jgi:hypothetical protein